MYSTIDIDNICNTNGPDALFEFLSHREIMHNLYKTLSVIDAPFTTETFKSYVQNHFDKYYDIVCPYNILSNVSSDGYDSVTMFDIICDLLEIDTCTKNTFKLEVSIDDMYDEDDISDAILSFIKGPVTNHCYENSDEFKKVVKCMNIDTNSLSDDINPTDLVIESILNQTTQDNIFKSYIKRYMLIMEIALESIDGCGVYRDIDEYLHDVCINSDYDEYITVVMNTFLDILYDIIRKI